MLSAHSIWLGLLSCAFSTDGSANVDAIATFLEEAVLMKDFSHTNVLGLCGVVLDVVQPMVFVELMEYGDLRTVIKREVRCWCSNYEALFCYLIVI